MVAVEALDEAVGPWSLVLVVGVVVAAVLAGLSWLSWLSWLVVVLVLFVAVVLVSFLAVVLVALAAVLVAAALVFPALVQAMLLVLSRQRLSLLLAQPIRSPHARTPRMT